MNPEDRLVSYEYDDRGLRTKLTYPDNSYITYEYDALSRLTQIIDDSNSVLTNMIMTSFLEGRWLRWAMMRTPCMITIWVTD